MVIGLHRVSYLFEAESRIQLVPSICFLKKDKHLSPYLSQNLLFVTLVGLLKYVSERGLTLYSCLPVLPDDFKRCTIDSGEADVLYQ